MKRKLIPGERDRERPMIYMGTVNGVEDWREIHPTNAFAGTEQHRQAHLALRRMDARDRTPHQRRQAHDSTALLHLTKMIRENRPYKFQQKTLDRFGVDLLPLSRYLRNYAIRANVFDKPEWRVGTAAHYNERDTTDSLHWTLLYAGVCNPFADARMKAGFRQQWHNEMIEQWTPVFAKSPVRYKVMPRSSRYSVLRRLNQYLHTGDRKGLGLGRAVEANLETSLEALRTYMEAYRIKLGAQPDSWRVMAPNKTLKWKELTMINVPHTKIHPPTLYTFPPWHNYFIRDWELVM
jgi:hypothetical protein